ncbi:MAG: hypothetical protein ACI86H_000631 [bacterium]|jgi:hypothetical protein
MEEETLKAIQTISRNLTFEPFDGKSGAEAFRKARTGLESGISNVKVFSKKAGSSLKIASEKTSKQFKKAGTWLSSSKFGKAYQDKVQELKAKESTPSKIDWEELKQKWEKTAKDIQEKTKAGYIVTEEWTKETTKTYLQRGLELVAHEDTEAWILSHAPTILENAKTHTIEEVRNLSSYHRGRLIEQLYPYDPEWKNLSKSLDVSFNFTLGTVAASNLPFTGMLVGLINMAKTMIKIAKRINTLCAIYGYPVQSPDSLFKVSAIILESLEDWESNPDHKPLSPNVLDGLFEDSEEKTGLKSLMTATVKKDAYITIPGLCTISLGKIHLDDLRMDAAVRQLVTTYFGIKELKKEVGEEKFETMTTEFQTIYQEFKKLDFFNRLRAALHQQKEELHGSSKWVQHLQTWVGDDEIFEQMIYELDETVLELYEQILELPEEEKEAYLIKEIQTLMKPLMAD